MLIASEIKSVQTRQAVEKFCAEVDFVTELFELDPNLPELIQLKVRAEEIVASDVDTVDVLRTLNPDYHVNANDTVVEFTGFADQYALKPSTLLRHHLGSNFDFIGKIEVSASGTDIYTVNGVLMATFHAIRISSGNPSDNIEVACDMIKELTRGHVELDHHELAGKVTSITVAEVDSEYFDGEDPDREWKSVITTMMS